MQMFADRTYEAILTEMLAAAPAGVDTRQSSIYFDAVSACAFKLAKFYIDAATVLDLVFIETASGEYLDQKGKEYSVPRNPATSARYGFVYEGTRPTAGARFFSDGAYFALAEENSTLYLDAEESGAGGNAIPEGDAATPVNSINGLTAARFGTLVEPGTDIEKDDDYRDRIKEKIGGPAQNGNQQHYKTWCEEVAGVGRARIIPLWAGENTVKGVLYDTEGMPAAQSVVDRVQEHVDPGGTGLGEGVANIGAHFTAAAAEAVELIVSFTVVLASGYSEADMQAAAENAMAEYLKGLALDTPDGENVVVRLSSIGALLYGLPPVLDYSELALNGSQSNVEIEDTKVAILKEVQINVAV